MVKSLLRRIRFQSDSFVTQVVVSVVGLALLFLAFLVIFIINSQVNDFNEDKKQIRHEVLTIKMNLIQSQTTTARRYITYAKEKYYKDIIQELKNRVNNDYRFVDYMYRTNKGESSAPVLRMIQDVYQVNPEDSKNNQRNFFVNQMTGRSVVNLSNPNNVGKDLSGLTDYRGNKVVQNEITNLVNDDRALLTYNLTPGDTTLFSQKITFIRKYAPLGIYFGEAIYLEDYLKEVKHKIIELLASIRFSDEGYIFLNTTDGYPLIKDGEIVKNPVNIWNLTDPNGVKVIQKEYEAAQTPGGDFIYYSWKKLSKNEVAKKVSFVIGVDEFNWMIGSGAYLDEINLRLHEREKALTASLYRNILMITLVFLTVLILGIFVMRRIIRTEQAQVNLFTDYFKESGDSYKKLDTNKTRYKEFRRMAESLNKMVNAHEEISEKHERDRLLLRYIIDAIPDNITYKNIQLEYQGCNKAFEKTFGISRDSLPGIKASRVFSEEVEKDIKQMERTLFAKKEPVRKEVWIKNKKGENVLFDIVKSFYYGQEGNILGIITVSRDITQKELQKKNLHMALEKANQSDQLKNAFLANISHEIRTPLNAIHGFSSLVNGKEIDLEELPLYLNRISTASEHLLRILENILFLALIESESISFYPVDTNLNKVLATTFDDVENRYHDKKDSIKAALRFDQEDINLRIDPFWIKVIFDNVLDNAFKFTEKGRVTAIIKNKQEQLHIEIADTGIGIAEGNERKLFNSFYRLSHNLNVEFRGTGSGLYIVKTLVSRLGGSVWFESRPSKGTVFNISIPNSIPENLLNTDEDVLSGFVLNGYTMVLLSSRDANFEFLRIMLNRKSAEVLRAKSVTDLIQICEDKNTDCIIIDALISGKNMVEDVSYIKSSVSTPVIVIASDSEMSSFEELYQAGASQVVEKPLKMSSLYESIKNAIIRKSR